jgi:transposase
MKFNVIGIDLAKNNFHLCGLDHKGKKVVERKFNRAKLREFIQTTPPCSMAIEACGGAHYWARLMGAAGHKVKMMSPQFVKPFVKTNKNDAHDAQAIAEASLRESIPSVPIKDVWQQDILAIHRVKERLTKNKVELTNQIRGLLFESGITISQGDKFLKQEIAELLAPENETLTVMMKTTIADLGDELLTLADKLKIVQQRIEKIAADDERCMALQEIPGIGPVTATALVAAVGNGKDFKNGRHLAAWMGLVPKHTGTGGVVKMLGISKRGDKYLRKLLIQGAHVVVRWSKAKDKKVEYKWIREKYPHRHSNYVAVAVANKTARMVWRILASNSKFDPAVAFASAG